MKNWFEIDVDGFRDLYKNKPKTFIINELVQNAFDENTKECSVWVEYFNNMIEVTVKDDSPEGFKNITHAYTLFADTYKRRDPTKRGRFNLGEKQVIAICNRAEVQTTKGTIVFDDRGRTKLDAKTKKGSIIRINFNGSEKDKNILIKHACSLLSPEGIRYVVNGKRIKSKAIFKSFEAKLLTDIFNGEILKVQLRDTYIHLIESSDQSYIYEMGIPIMKTDCLWHIDVQQKVQLNIDRDNILPSYVQDLYAEVVNNAYEHITEHSALWVRTAMKDTRIKKETVAHIMKERFTDKYCIANPLDSNAMEDAISHGFKPIYGGEMSGDEWDIVKDLTNIQSATQLFGNNDITQAEVIQPNKNQKITALYAKKIADRLLDIKVKVKFVTANGTSRVADYDREDKILRFNVGHPYLKQKFFDEPTGEKPTKLIIHELSHEDGGHIDYDYQEMQSTLGAKLTMLGRNEPSFFKVN